MSKALYDIYEQSCMDLAKTLVLKSSAVANVFNATLIKNLWPAPSSDMTTWRYYMNLAGEYHEYDEKYLSNEAIPGRMTIKVASASGPIDAAFTRELIENDAVIANEYRYGSPFYQALVAKYPVCVDLIHGILNPVEKDVAISAQEGEILYAGGYFKTIVNEKRLFIPRVLAGRKPPNYIEENEDNLLPKLEAFIQGTMSRWNNVDYHQNNDLFITSQLSILYMNLPGKILNIRLANCFTHMVHSYHVREYLESNGKLIRYVDSIPKQQLLWLYRNLRYLEKNIGKEETFQLLIDKLIDPLKMPLLGYELKHNLANQDAISPAEDYPETVMFRRALSEGGIALGDSNRAVSKVMNSQLKLARENSWNFDIRVQNVIDQMTYRSRSNLLPTKVIESSVTDDSQSIMYPLANVLFSLWAYQASRDEYVASVYVTHPVTGLRSLLSPKQCLVAYIYLITRDWEDPPSEIPELRLHNIPRHPTVSEPGVPAKASLDFFKSQLGKYLSKAVITDLYGSNVPLEEPSTVGAFYEQAYEVYEELMRRYTITTKISDLTEKSVAENLFNSLYFRATVRPATAGTTFDVWMEDSGMDLSTLTVEQRKALSNDILIAVTGSDAETSDVKLRKRQEAIINAMRYLSTYAIQYLTEVTGSRAFPGAWGPLRLGNFHENGNSINHAELGQITAFSDKSSEKTITGLELVQGGLELSCTTRELTDISIVSGAYASSASQAKERFKLPTSRFTILLTTETIDDLATVAPDNVLDGFQYPTT